MEQLLAQLAQFGIAGIVAFLFYKLYTEEKKEHAITRQKLIDSLGDRIVDSKETVLKVTEPLGNISQGIQNISDKIEISKGRK
jgi:hypothetical protein